MKMKVLLLGMFALFLVVGSAYATPIQPAEPVPITSDTIFDVAVAEFGLDPNYCGTQGILQFSLDLDKDPAEVDVVYNHLLGIVNDNNTPLEGAILRVTGNGVNLSNLVLDLDWAELIRWKDPELESWLLAMRFLEDDAPEDGIYEMLTMNAEMVCPGLAGSIDGELFAFTAGGEPGPDFFSVARGAVTFQNRPDILPTVPEPASMVLFGLGLLGMARIGRRQSS